MLKDIMIWNGLAHILAIKIFDSHHLSRFYGICQDAQNYLDPSKNASCSFHGLCWNEVAYFSYMEDLYILIMFS